MRVEIVQIFLSKIYSTAWQGGGFCKLKSHNISCFSKIECSPTFYTLACQSSYTNICQSAFYGCLSSWVKSEDLVEKVQNCQMDTGQITLVRRGLALPAPILLLTLDKLRRSKQFQLHLLPFLLFIHILLTNLADKCRRRKQFNLHSFSTGSVFSYTTHILLLLFKVLSCISSLLCPTLCSLGHLWSN